MRPTWKDIRLGLAYSIIGLLVIACDRATAQDWTKPELKCVPTVTDYDRYAQAKDGIFAVVWWCDQEDGVYTNWFTGRVLPQSPDIVPATIAAAGRDPLYLDKLMVRASSAAELSLVRDIEASHAPRCYTVGSGATAAVVTETAQHTAGPAKLDAAGVGVRIKVGTIVTCVDRLSKEPDKRYCNVLGSTDSKARKIEGDAWALCRIDRSPAEGWQ